VPNADPKTKLASPANQVPAPVTQRPLCHRLMLHEQQEYNHGAHHDQPTGKGDQDGMSGGKEGILADELEGVSGVCLCLCWG